MNEFEKIYLKTISEETQQVELNSSTELVDENEVTNESLGKWAKNTFTKFGKKSVKKEMEKTIKAFREMYKFERFDADKPKLYGKIEDGYLITVKFNVKDFKKSEVIVNVISPKSKQTVQDFKNVIIPIKHSNTEEEIAKKINEELSDIDISISETEGHIPDDFFETASAKTSAGNTENNSSEALNKVANMSGFETETFKEKLKEVDGNKQQKLTLIKSLISGWKKLDANERKIFQQLQK